MRSATPTRLPLENRFRRGPEETSGIIAICDRCGDITVDDSPCRCRTPYDETEVQRRHREAVARARATASGPGGQRRSNPAA